MFNIYRRTRRSLGSKELGKSYKQPEQVVSRINNYVTRPSALPLLHLSHQKSLGQSCGLPTRFTRFIHLQKCYLWTKFSVHWEHLYITLRGKPSQSRDSWIPRPMMQEYSQVYEIYGCWTCILWCYLIR